jgi:ABC-type branched-subunit amino acid transport system substrate-binding protein
VSTASRAVLLDAIARSDGTRGSVARALKSTHLPDSVIGPLSLAPDGEPVGNPMSVLRVERHERQLQAILDTRGASRVDMIDPPARLVGAGTQ